MKERKNQNFYVLGFLVTLKVSDSIHVQYIVHLLGTRTGHHIHQILLVKMLVSPLLFNFMAWMLGFSDDPEDVDYI
jgi:predicted permease